MLDISVMYLFYYRVYTKIEVTIGPTEVVFSVFFLLLSYSAEKILDFT